MAGYSLEMQEARSGPQAGPIDEPISKWHIATCVMLGSAEDIWQHLRTNYSTSLLNIS